MNGNVFQYASSPLLPSVSLTFLIIIKRCVIVTVRVDKSANSVPGELYRGHNNDILKCKLMVHFPKSAVDPPEKRLGIEPKVT